MPDYFSGQPTDPYQSPAYPPSYAPRSRPWYGRTWGVAIIVALALLFAGVVAFGLMVYQIWQQADDPLALTITPTGSATDTAAKDSARQQLEKLDRPLFGNEQSRVVIVEFGDFQCPYCTKEFPIIRAVMNKYKDDVLFIYRHFPVTNENSQIIAQASMCAHEQGKFWAMHDRLYANHDELLVDAPTVIRQAAVVSGVAMASFDECMSSQKFAAQVNQDAQDGTDMGVRGTPTFFINGNKIEGVVTAQQWDQVITKALELTKGQ